jgi:hypothetical protein
MEMAMMALTPTLYDDAPFQLQGAARHGDWTTWVRIVTLQPCLQPSF